jgi:carbamoyl-phosphate synthase/aspartate carbamoyltransferase/dihydroorotase
VIDVFATDHAPHTLAEKDGENPPPGFPGLETALPLFLTAGKEGRLSLDDIIQRMVINPRKIFAIPEQPETWVEIDPEEEWEIRGEYSFTRCGWTPFEGKRVTGRVNRVVLHGRDVYRDREVLAHPGFGKNIRQSSHQV